MGIAVKFDDLALSDPQRRLVRKLRILVPEDAKCAAIVLASLDGDERDALPTESGDLLDFVRVHLMPPLREEVGPNLAAALLNELTTEVMEMGEAPSRGPNIKTPQVVIPVRPPPKNASGVNGTVKVSFPKLRQSVANLVRTASMRIRAAVASAKSSPAASHLGHRPLVLLVHSDRVVRASIARALVNAGFDVSVFDATLKLIPELKRRTGSCVAIFDIWEKGVEATLRTLVAANPEVRVLAWTDIEATVAESLLAMSGVKGFVVLPKTGAEIELVDSARRLLRES